jgi:hypothetical protein
MKYRIENLDVKPAGYLGWRYEERAADPTLEVLFRLD